MNTAKKFVTGALLVGALGCNDGKTPPATGAKVPYSQQIKKDSVSHDGIAAMNDAMFIKNGDTTQAKFIKGNGEEETLSALQTKLKGHYTTFSFMIDGCGSTCPLITSALKQLSEKYPDIHHVVIAHRPQQDYPGLDNWVTMMGLRMDGPNPNVTVLYPTTNDGTMALFNGNDISEDIQHKLGLLTIGATAHHTSVITLFDPSGKKIAQSVGSADKMAKELSEKIGKDTVQGR